MHQIIHPSLPSPLQSSEKSKEFDSYQTYPHSRSNWILFHSFVGSITLSQSRLLCKLCLEIKEFVLSKAVVKIKLIILPFTFVYSLLLLFPLFTFLCIYVTESLSYEQDLVMPNFAFCFLRLRKTPILTSHFPSLIVLPNKRPLKKL